VGDIEYNIRKKYFTLNMTMSQNPFYENLIVTTKKVRKARTKRISEKSKIWSEYKNLLNNKKIPDLKITWRTKFNNMKTTFNNAKDHSKKISSFLSLPSDKNTISLNANIFPSFASEINMSNDHLLELHYTLNGVDTYKIISHFDEIDRILQTINNGITVDKRNIHASESEAILDLIIAGDDFDLKWISKKQYRQNHRGAYFKYFHNTSLNLTRYQIYNKHEKINYEPCLYYSIFNHLNYNDSFDNNIDALKLSIFEKDIKMSDIASQANSLECKITITFFDEKKQTRTRVYGSQYTCEINLGLIDNHYFINEQTDITTKFFTGRKGTQHKKLTSYELIYRLFKEKDKYLFPISIENINNHNHTLSLDNDYVLRNPKIACKCIGKDEKVDCFKVDGKLCKHQYCEIMTMEENFCYCAKLDEKTEKRVDMKKYNEYKSFKTSSGMIFNGKWKDDTSNPNLNFKLCHLDIETYASTKDETRCYSNSDELIQTHKPFCVGYSYENASEKYFYGENCILDFLNSIKTHIVIVTHNLAFDIRPFIQHLARFCTPIESGNKMKHLQCKYNNFYIAFKDNCAFLPYKLSELPEMFNLPSGDKGVYPYSLINENNYNSFIPLEECLKHLKSEEDEYDFIMNCKKIGALNDTLVDIKEYTIHYCLQDVNILKQSYLKFREQIKEVTKIDIITMVSLPQVANDFLIDNDCYDGCFKISGVAQDFIRKATHGGRVMVANNKKIKFEKKDHKRISDFDAVSLYPSAMYRIPGFIRGLPKVIKNYTPNSYDYYFVEIKITNIKKARAFPLASFVDEAGIKQYTNDLIGKTMVIDKVALEDLIKYQGVEYEFIRGYYFDDGFNTKITETIEFMFNERIKLKEKNNSLEQVYKLLMNSSYGKLGQKPITKSKKFIIGDYYNYVVSNAKDIVEYQRISDDMIVVTKRKSIMTHFNAVHLSAQILSMSKRIMNEVMCLAEDNDIPIYYQDTDSMHIDQHNITKLKDLFKETYERDLIGKNMGQFHSDFSVKGADKDYEIVAVESIFLGKKAYIDKLEYKQNGEIKYTYHIRMKGIPSKVVEDFDSDVMKTYMRLHDKEEIEFNLLSCCPLKFTKNYNTINNIKFLRKVKFT